MADKVNIIKTHDDRKESVSSSTNEIKWVDSHNPDSKSIASSVNSADKFEARHKMEE